MMAGYACPYCLVVRKLGDGGCCRAREDVDRLAGYLLQATSEANQARLEMEELVGMLRGNEAGNKAHVRGACAGLATRLHSFAALWAAARGDIARALPPAPAPEPTAGGDG